MQRLYVPVAVTVVLIASLTVWESVYSDRFTGSSINAEDFNKRFANVPMKVGSWVGTDTEVKEETLNTAGAVSHVSRTYVNSDTGQRADLWLIVGHSRDINRHTPDICYPSQGFAQDGTTQKQSVDAVDGTKAVFNTARFRQESPLGQGGPLVRVFWGWNANQPDEKDWIAPESQRRHFGNNTALYKMYFTSSMKDRDELVTDNNAMDFAKVMIPEVNKALFPELYPAAPEAEESDASKSEDVAPAPVLTPDPSAPAA
jgi:hypothetical protein